MSATKLVEALRREGFTFIPLPEGKLAVTPADRITDDLRQRIRQCKSEVLALLTSEPLPTTDREPTPDASLEPIIFWTDSRKIDPENPPAPYLNSRQELVIPSECAPRYRWWAGGQSIRATLLELGASKDVLARYVDSTETLKVRQ